MDSIELSRIVAEARSRQVTLHGHFAAPVRIEEVEPIGDGMVQVRVRTAHGGLDETVLALGELASALAASAVTSRTAKPEDLFLWVEQHRIRLAYAHDPYFAVSLSGVRGLPHQVEAVYRHLLPQPRLRFVLADDPGAGKTIMAGLLMKELKLRGVADRILVVAPAPLTYQWQDEMANRFDERFDVVGSAQVRWELGGSPWQQHNQVVTSLDFAKQDDVLPDLLRAEWDLVVIDEAHKCSAATFGDEVKRTKRYVLAEELSRRADRLLLLTATPHSGDQDRFTHFLALLDPDQFATADLVRRQIALPDSPYFLRRQKEDLIDERGRRLFVERRVLTQPFELSPAELVLYEAVTDYINHFLGAAPGGRGHAVALARTVLQRRLASSLGAIRSSLAKRAERLGQRADELERLPPAERRRRLMELQVISYDSEETTDDADEDVQEQAATEISAAEHIDQLRVEVEELRRLEREAERVMSLGEERKLTALRHCLKRAELAEMRDGRGRLLLFTEHRDTLEYLVRHLVEWGYSVCSIHGGQPPVERRRIQQEFHQDRQICVATEAAGEGINLQFCHLMINYDLPWNPVRLEQRMGRIHRIGQESEVWVFNFCATNTIEGQLLARLNEKLDEMRSALQGRVYDVIGDLLAVNGLDFERLLRDTLSNPRRRETSLEEIGALSPELLKHYEAEVGVAQATRSVDLSWVRHRDWQSVRRLEADGVPEACATFADPAASGAYRLHFLTQEVVAEADGGRREPAFGELVAVIDDDSGFTPAPADVLHDLTPVADLEPVACPPDRIREVQNWVRVQVQARSAAEERERRLGQARLRSDYLEQAMTAQRRHLEERWQEYDERVYRGEERYRLLRDDMVRRIEELERRKRVKLEAFRRLGVVRPGPVAYLGSAWIVPPAAPVPAVYAQPERFFAATYFSVRMRELLQDVFAGLAGGHGDRVLQLRTPFGGGKTHSLVALLHLARDRAAAAGVLELAEVPDPGPVRVAVLSGEELDPLRPMRSAGGVETHTLWGELAAQLGCYDVVAEHDRARSAPGGDALRQVLGEGPVLLLLDEVLIYVEKAMAVRQGDSTLGRQAMLFMQALTESVNSRPGAVMVYSLQASAGEAAGAEGLLAQLDHLVSRIDAKREPVSGDEVLRVVQRRLFADLGDTAIHREIARAYADLVGRNLRAQAETEDARREAIREASRMEERVLASYPFHPALLDLMYHRWGTLPSYQRTRGALQFLACVTHDLWERGDDSALIGPGEVNLGDPPTRGAFFTQVGERERYQAVLDGDVTSDGSGAAVVDRRIGLDSPGLAQLRVGTRMATAIMLYSFGSREGEERGVLESDLVTATLVPGLDRNVIVAALHDLREEQLFLHYSARRYRYEPTYNLTKLVRDEGNRFAAEEVLDAVREALGRQLSGERHALIWPEGGGAIPDRVPAFQFAYLHPDWSPDRLPLDRLLSQAGTSKRAYLNAVGFVLPDTAQFDRARAAARLRLATEALLGRRASMGFLPEQAGELKEKLAAAGRDLAASVGNAYASVSIPVRSEEGGRPHRWQESDLRSLLTAGRTLHQRVLEAVAGHVFSRVTVDRLIDRCALGRERQFVLGSDLVNWFFSYFDFPKLLDRAPIQEAIGTAVTEGRLAYTVGAEARDGELVVRDPSLVRQRRLLPPSEVELSGDAAIMTPELAATLLPAPTPALEEAAGLEPPPSSSVPPDLTPGEVAEPGEAVRHLNLRARLDADALFALNRALSSLRDKSSSIDVELTVRANAGPDGYDLVAIRNGVIEPLTEAGVEDMRVDMS